MLTHNITNRVETQKKLTSRQAFRIATQSPDKWTRKAAEWKLELVMPTRSQRKAGRPAKRWEDVLDECVKDEETQTTHSNDLKNNNTWLTAANKDLSMGNERKQYTEHVIDD